MVSNTGVQAGNSVSHAKNRNRKRFLPNLQPHRIWFPEENRRVTLRVNKKGLRMIDKIGIAAVVAQLRRQGIKV